MVNKGSNFKSEIEGRVEKYQDSLKVYGAFYEDKLVGVIATRNSGNHNFFCIL